MEKTIERDKIFEGKIISVFLDTVQLENGKISKREIVQHGGAVAALAFTSDNQLVLVRQFRKPIDDFLVEIPAGKIEKGEQPEETIRRELVEETGYEVQRLSYLTKFFTSAGFSNEIVYLYVAELGAQTNQSLDEDEIVELIEIPIEVVEEKILSGEIKDAKTILAVSLYNLYKQKESYENQMV